VKCRFKSSRIVQPVCTNSHVRRPDTPSLPINGSKEIGLFVAAISSLCFRPQYNKLPALVKNLLTSITIILLLWRLRFRTEEFKI